MLLPALAKARNKALAISCSSNLKQIGTSHKQYSLDCANSIIDSRYGDGTTYVNTNGGGWPKNADAVEHLNYASNQLYWAVSMRPSRPTLTTTRAARLTASTRASTTTRSTPPTATRAASSPATSGTPTTATRPTARPSRNGRRSHPKTSRIPARPSSARTPSNPGMTTTATCPSRT